MRTRWGHVLWTALLLIAGGGPAAGRLCRDGWGMQGACVSLRSCDSMQQLIRSRPSSDDIARIKASICQTEGGLIVCCALPTTTTTTTTTTQAPLDLSKFDPNTPEGNPKRLLLPRDCGMLVDERIVGGEEAQLGGHPWLALLGFKDTNTYDNYYNYYDDEAAAPAAETEPKVKFSCGAALINNRYVVTAAHCIPKPGESGEILKIRLGEHDLKTEVDCRSMGTDQATGVEKKECNEPPVDIAIERITNHPQFDRPVKNMNDIALIRLAKPVNFTKWITPICLPFEQWRTAELPNDKAIAAGFGLTKAFGDTSPTLQELTVPLVDLNICKTIFARMRARLTDTQMCAGGNVGQDSCEGDSGGPLIMHDRFGPPYHLVGITSFGSQSCGVGATPGVYTRVSQYMDWILQNIAP